MTIKDFISLEIPVIDKNDSLAEFARQLEKTGFDKALVAGYTTNGSKRLCGVVTSRDILVKIVSERLRRSSLGRLRISGFMTENPYKAYLNTDIVSLVKTMSSRGYGIIPIEDETLHGAVIRKSLLKLLFNDPTPVRSVMDNHPLKARTSDSLLDVRQKILGTDKSFVIVVNESGEPRGYLTVKEVAYAFATFIKNVPERFRKERINQLIAQDYMIKNWLEIKVDSSIGEAAKSIYESNTKGAVVIGGRGLEGVVTESELINYLAISLLSGRQIG
ncbi:MAG: CBS domain-containing protein [Thermosphaera aggregans]|jgi:CBS domain-containing protein|uniref:CBS domain-containing protein n=1 Tax=Thermosphaera aggregans TaxID=54254 RepID=UPI003C1158CC